MPSHTNMMTKPMSGLALLAAVTLLLAAATPPAHATGLGLWQQFTDNVKDHIGHTTSVPSAPAASSNFPSGNVGGGGGGSRPSNTVLGDWRTARATFYGGADDWWSIHEGSCGFGYLDDWCATGWDVAALTDSCDMYHDSCGACYEVKCDPGVVKDGYGASLDRTKACWDSGSSIVVMVTDTCPCHYPANGYSNRRWCCGDVPHFDLSVFAFQKLADVRLGVIGLQVRRVSCDLRPSRKALLPSWVTAARPNTRISRPGNWRDRRPWP